MIPTSDGVGFWLLKSSGQAAVLVVLVLAAQWRLRHRLAPCWRYSLWWLVVLRLVLPVSPESLLSIFNWTPRVAAWTPDDTRAFPLSGQPGPIIPEPMPERVSTRSDAPSVSLPSSVALLPAQPTEASDHPSFEPSWTAAPASPIKASPPGISWRQALVGVWLAGMAALLAHVGWAQLRLRRWLAGARTITDTTVLKLLGDCQELMQVRRSITVLETGALQSPALCGLVHPRLLLPAGLLGRFSKPELRYVFLHELAHLKRHDIAAHWLTTLVQIVHWFNPFVWLAFNRMRADRELACDARALAASETGEQQAYGRTIIKLLEGFSQGMPAPGLVGILENKGQLKQRIRMISNYGRQHQGHVVAVLLLVGLGLVGLTDATSASKKDTGSEQIPSAVDIAPRPVVTNGPSMKITVLDAETSTPIAGAFVYAPSDAARFGRLENAPRWTSDAAGVAQIRLGEVPREPISRRASFNISVRCPGYAPIGLSWLSSTSDARLQMTNEVTVRLERGIKIGGVVQDERGVPVPHVRVRVFGNGKSFSSGNRLPKEYPEFRSDASDSPAIVTDQAGRWEMNDFPRHLENVEIECQPTDGSAQVFRRAAVEYNPIIFMGGEPLKLEDLRVGQAVLALKPGFTVRGIVMDPAGKPLAGVLVKEGYGLNRKLSGEFRTDDKGRFERRSRPRRQLIFTAYPTHHAITTAIVDVGSDTREVRLQLQPASPLRLKVVDEQGMPVAGASVKVDNNGTEGQMLEFQGITTAEGALTWTNAPRIAMALRIDAPNLGVDRMLRILVNQREVTCRLRRGENEEVQVHGQVRDADTGQPVQLAWIAFYQEVFKNREPRGRSDFVIPVTKFRAGIYPSYQLQLCAEGYENLISDWRDFDEGDWDAVFLMRKGGRRSGQIVLGNGKPAVGADIFALEKEDGHLRMIKPGRVIQDGDKIHELAGLDGRFSVEHTGWDSLVLITHEQGFISTSLYQLKNQPQLALQPWGRVEGILRLGTQPQKGVKVCLTGGKKGRNGWDCYYDCNTDAEGRFVFDKVPPGEHLLYRDLHQGVGAITRSRPMPVYVNAKAGKITRVNYGGTGRPVIGRVAGEVDWSRDTQLLVGTIVPADLNPAPRTEDYATRAAFEKARDADTTLTRALQMLDGRSWYYQLSFDKDGSFRIDDIPAGTYELRLRVIQPPDHNINRFNLVIPGKELAWLEREVVVPEMPGGRSDTPLDLGELTLNWADPSHPGVPAGSTGSNPK